MVGCRRSSKWLLAIGRAARVNCNNNTVLVIGLGSQAYQHEVLLISCSSIGILTRSLLIRVAVRYEYWVAIVVKYRAHLLVGLWIIGILV